MAHAAAARRLRRRLQPSVSALGGGGGGTTTLLARLHGTASSSGGGTVAAGKPVFYDMLHSNNAARVRLWMKLKRPTGMADAIDTCIVTYPELQSAEFAKVNPLKKVPALVRADGVTVFESNVILSFLEDKYAGAGAPMTPPTAEGRQSVELLCRIHDLYIASPNCTQPGFSHSQGGERAFLMANMHRLPPCPYTVYIRGVSCREGRVYVIGTLAIGMYLSNGWHGPAR
jgi:hypothetical protein